MAEREMGAISGAAQGAQAGAKFGPAGAAIGAVIGAVSGAAAGHAAGRARLYQQRASKTEAMMMKVQAAIQRREMIRQSRFAIAEQLSAASAGGEGGMLSSGYGGVMGSLISQTGRNIQLFDASTRDQVQMNMWLANAAKKSAQASNITGMMNLAASVANFAGTNMQAGKTWYGGTKSASFDSGLATQQVNAASNAMTQANYTTTIRPVGGG